MADAYCAAPFVGVEVNTQAQLNPCCEYQPEKIFDISQFAEWREEMVVLGNKLLTGQRPQECSRCWKNEQAGLSYRAHMNQQFPESFHQEPIKYVALQFGNICNLRCLHCNANHSSSIAAEQYKHKALFVQQGFPVLDKLATKWQSSDTFLNLLESWSSSLTHIFLHGGEPLLTTDAIEFLRSLSKKQNIILSITTNATTVTPDIVNLISEFKQVNLTVSLDGVGKHAEYVRYGCAWIDQINNIEMLMQLPNLQKTICIHSVFQHTSAYTLPGLVDFCLEKKLILSLGFLVNPDYLSIHGMNPLLKQKFQNTLDNLIQTHRHNSSYNEYVGVAIDRALTWLKDYQYQPGLAERFADHVDLLDQIRRTDFSQTFGIELDTVL